jgi:peptidoglycan hydrolase CwlO-like protein
MDSVVITVIGSVIAAIVGAASAYGAARASANASTKNTTTSVEGKRLEQAYERARKFDIDTISRQDQKIAHQEEEIQDLSEKLDEKDAQILALRLRVAHLEQRLGIKPPEENQRESQ